MASKDGIYTPFDWYEILKPFGDEVTGAALRATANLIKGEDPGTDNQIALGFAAVFAREIEIVKQSKERKKEIDSNYRKSKKEKEILNESKRIETIRNECIEIETETETETEIECVSTPQPVENSAPVENTHTREHRLAEIPESYLDYFSDRVRAKGYKFADPEAALLSWWARDKDKPEWQKRKQMPSSFDTDDFFSAAVEASERRMQK